MKKNATKRALLTSVIALLLCVSMLVGTTFAWFTDSVTSANNIIQSGNLDVEMYYQVEGQSDWTKVTSETNVFMENALWEPGHTEVVKLKIVNEGSLALKYNLGVNIVSETASVNQKGVAFRLSDYIKFAVIGREQDYTRELAVVAAEAAEATTLKTAYNSGVTNLYVDDPATTDVKENEKIVTMVVYMPTSVGNEANHAKGAAQPTIKLGLNLFATQLTAEFDSFNNQYDKNAIIVTTAEEAQAALDNATADTTIQLVPGVDYGMLTFRQTASSTVVDITTAGGDAPGNEKYRRIEDLTIIGAEGAVIDGFDFKVSWIDGSGASYIDVENLTVKGVTFSGEATPFNFEGAKGSALGIDGLTIIDCKMEDANSNNRFVFQQISGYKELIDKTTNAYVMTAGIKDLTITECEVIGAYMVIESRAMENLTITNNIFKGIKQRDMLITSDTTNHADKTYTGTITITGNTSIEGEERFVRGSLNNSDAVVVIKDNTLINYMGADADYIKVTDGNNVTIENNNLNYGFSVANDAELTAALDTIKTNSAFWNKEVTIAMAAGEYSGDHVINQYPQWNGEIGAGGSANNYGAGVPTGAPITKLVFVGQAGTTFTGDVTVNGFGNAGTGFASATATTTFKNIIFDAANSVEENGEDYAVLQLYAAANNVTFDGCTFQNATHVRLGPDSGVAAVGRVDVKNCTFNDGGCLSGYFETLNVENTNVTAAKNGFINKSKAGAVTITGGTINAGKYFLRTSNSGVNVTVTGATISLYESEGSAKLVRFRGSNESLTFINCTLPATYTTEGIDANSTLTIQQF